jgi:3-dehydroquinate synthase
VKTIKINLAERSYKIHIGENLIFNDALFRDHTKDRQVAIITNETIKPIYLDCLIKTLDQSKQTLPIILKDGEKYKNKESLEIIYNELLENKFDRNSILIALGGGVIGDITGFAAATFMRGIDFIQVPTSLLAQVDSSVGGKTGINHALGKNMIGAFYQPKLVVIDINVLKTLPVPELSAGLAEVIKYGLIRDKDFFNWLEKSMLNIMNLESDFITEAIYRSCQNKAAVVSQDEFESKKGIRATLNLGHTFGHAIENAVGYGNWLHGEAVACGMTMAASMSTELGWLTLNEFDRIKLIIQSANLPINPPKIDQHHFLNLMMSDKKTLHGKINLILQKGIGKAIQTSDYPEEILLQTIQRQIF